MTPDNTPQTTAEFLLRRIEDPLPTAAIFLPVVFAFAGIALIVLFRRERKFAGMLWGTLVVGICSAVYLTAAFLLKDLFSWWVVLVPVVVVALLYVVLMYYRDTQSINGWWAAFLGTLRCLV